MGFSLTGSHVIFFVAAIIVAGTVSGIFTAVILDISGSISDRADRIQTQLNTEFEIINDPNNIPLTANSSYRIFYLKNIGSEKLLTTKNTFHAFIDGDLVSSDNYYFESSSISTSEVTELYIATSEISSDDHTLRVVGPQAIDDEFTFTIS